MIAVAALRTRSSAAMAAIMGWLLIEYLMHKKATSMGAASGIVAGLVAITPAAGAVDGGRPLASAAMRVLARFLDVVIVALVFGSIFAAVILSGDDDAGLAGFGADASFGRAYLVALNRATVASQAPARQRAVDDPLREPGLDQIVGLGAHELPSAASISRAAARNRARPSSVPGSNPAPRPPA